MDHLVNQFYVCSLRQLKNALHNAKLNGWSDSLPELNVDWGINMDQLLKGAFCVKNFLAAVDHISRFYNLFEGKALQRACLRYNEGSANSEIKVKFRNLL